MPAPMTSAVSPPCISADAHTVQRDRDGLEHGGLGKGQAVRQAVGNALRHRNEFGKGAVRGGIRRRRRR